MRNDGDVARKKAQKSNQGTRVNFRPCRQANQPFPYTLRTYQGINKKPSAASKGGDLIYRSMYARMRIKLPGFGPFGTKPIVSPASLSPMKRRREGCGQGGFFIGLIVFVLMLNILCCLIYIFRLFSFLTVLALCTTTPLSPPPPRERDTPSPRRRRGMACMVDSVF